ncbi:hypothetical protein BKK49_11705 [Rodentibacter rarus]|uniref:Uncharacterized protein n=2 Tax=Rodentibacter rarus TaxID=1908260 RepID=A0A1V3IFF9_9PAST|nr:hypothetical protein [Rodentibacter rarus]OOF36863.1 hypothetical protein BKK49_11705 [Rodentibacter rarus]OOF38981.1 hypothetical protein BKK50_11155 [Rodentibacter rarus]
MGRIITQTVRVDTEVEVDIDLDDLDLLEFMPDITLKEFFRHECGELTFVALEAMRELRTLQGEKSNLIKIMEELTGAYV